MLDKSTEVTVDVTKGKDPDPEDIIDLAKVAAKYNAKAGTINFDSRCDRNVDGIIDLYDLVTIAKTMI